MNILEILELTANMNQEESITFRSTSEYSNDLIVTGEYIFIYNSLTEDSYTIKVDEIIELIKNDVKFIKEEQW